MFLKRFWFLQFLLPLYFMIGEDGEGGTTVDDDPEPDPDAATPAAEADPEAEPEPDAELEADPDAEPEPDADKNKPADRYANLTPEQLRAELKRMSIAEKTERTKRQQLQKKYGGIKPPADPARRAADDKPKSLDEIKDLKEYDDEVNRKIERTIAAREREKEYSTRLESTQTEMTKKFDGSNGLPAYDEIVDEHVIPMIEKNPMLYHLIRMSPHPGGMSYLLALNAMHGGDIEKIAGMFKTQGRQQLLDNIDQAGKKALRLKGRGNIGNSGKGQTLEQLMAMGDDAFENEINKVKNTR